MDWRPISADSHITEPPNCYVENIDPAFRERAPRVVSLDKMGAPSVVEGLNPPVPLGLLAAAGVDPKDIRVGGARFEDLHKSGWDPKHRIADQDRDGVAAEIIYPTVGMLICNHPDFDYKKACFDAYNRWLQGYVAHDPSRLIGLGQTALRTVKEGIEDLERIRAMGFRGVMMPGNPGEKDYDDPAYDPFWEAAIALDMPLCRGEPFAEAGTLLVIGGGDKAAFERCRPALQAFATSIYYLGDVGAGQVGKMVNNLILWACVSANDEGLALGKALGVDPEKMRAALHHSSAQNWAMDWRAEDSGMPWAEKDMNILLREADMVRIAMPLAGTTKEVIKGLKIRMGLGLPEGFE